MSSRMSNGWLTSPATRSVKPVPFPAYDVKSTTDTLSPDDLSSPTGIVVPLWTTSPFASSSSHATAFGFLAVAIFASPGK